MPISVDFTLANPDPELKMTNYTDLVALLRIVLAGSIPDLQGFVIGSTTPSVDDQDKVWYRTDAGPTGLPVGIYRFSNGFWLLPPPPLGARIGYWNGDPTLGQFDSTGLGLPGAGPVASEFFGWAIANGNNTTANLTDKFLVGAHMDNSGGVDGWSSMDNLWRTDVTGNPEATGGLASNTLDATNTYQAPTDEVKVGTYTADGEAPASDALFGTFVEGHASTTLIAAGAGVTSPLPFGNVPPYMAFAILGWVGYDYAFNPDH